MFDNVLVGVGDPEAALDAVALAREFVSSDGGLTLVHVQTDEGQRELSALELFRDELARDAQVATTKDLSAARGLHELSRLRAADLIVVGSSRAGDVDRMLIGDDTRDVVDGAPCPVAVAPVGYASPAGPLTEIGVVYDGSPVGDRALELASALAARSQSKVWPLPSGGITAEELAHHVEPSVDLLVLGTHEHRMDNFLGVSRSQTLADRPVTPLLVLPPAAHGSRGEQPERARPSDGLAP
jgi:nucleotide-binding universal stress UspA family protein